MVHVKASSKALRWECSWVQKNSEADMAKAEEVRRRGVRYEIREVVRSYRDLQPCLDFTVNETESHCVYSDQGVTGSDF